MLGYFFYKKKILHSPTEIASQGRMIKLSPVELIFKVVDRIMFAVSSLCSVASGNRLFGVFANSYPFVYFCAAF